MKLIDIINNINLDGCRGTLVQVYRIHGNLDVEQELVDLIFTPNVNKADIRRRFTEGRGAGKPHWSEHVLSRKASIREGKLKNS